ncbi:Saccharopine dehydrogenase-domain-containing protein [Cytidiella melzeri]|nr:Saccharopine dehydrogenase-domain-containing protein [Cytidiella melzeri]
MVDILVIGATGFTGQLIVKYFSQHPERSEFTLGVAARSKSKLGELKQKLGLPDSVQQFCVDVTKQHEVDEVVQIARVVINAVGPYWTCGTPVLKACAHFGRHYVDLSGEPHWIRDMVLEYDFVASKTHAMIIPACGFDSVPSELAVFLSNKTLKTLAGADTEIDTSITAFNVKGGLSGGSFNTFFTAVEQVPRYKMQIGHTDWALSTHVSGARKLPKRLVYTLPFSNPPIFGGTWFMAASNKAIVQRSWGLNERALWETQTKDAKLRSYGSKFKYDEFKVAGSKLSSALLSLGMLCGLVVIIIPPLRWLAKKLAPRAGDGPSEEQMKKGYMEITNVSSSVATASHPATHVRTVIKGHVDPGYLLASVMAAESALTLLLSQSELPEWARKGGVLTPGSALGDALVKRLEASGQISFESEVVLGRETETRKTK